MSAAASPPPNRRRERALNWLLWHGLLDWNGEKRGSLSLLGWGLWVSLCRPLTDSPGWHYLVWIVRWQPVPADLVWGPLLVALGTRQFGLALRTYDLSPARRTAAFWTGLLFCFFTVALFLGAPGGTGVPIYGLLAWDSFATYYQLTLRSRGRMGL